MRSVEGIAARIMVVRGQRVMIDADLALLYGVSTKQLNQQVKRNPTKFPTDLAFRLSAKEKDEVVTNCDQLRRLRYSTAMPLVLLESKVGMHDRAIGQILAAIRQLTAPPETPRRRRIGFL